MCRYLNGGPESKQPGDKGIDMARQSEHLFGLYKRFDLAVEGKGMGLFMVKMQVERLGGKITAESTVNRGTEFKIEFPV